MGNETTGMLTSVLRTVTVVGTRTVVLNSRQLCSRTQDIVLVASGPSSGVTGTYQSHSPPPIGGPLAPWRTCLEPMSTCYLHLDGVGRQIVVVGSEKKAVIERVSDPVLKACFEFYKSESGNTP